ncbi:mediator complex subunit 25 von Willebrand factor type A-domain-containing protein [Fimicolochytrium jonesii]|uniref:mediator complex subunit 25 von Willebrand factor type A-domain-containing protein n=1 Tax=Fimicolochytrium jonesii TaxID=1396493 RepID=UPI0022FF02EB|nr:mediator complex subunit 25 von Willebrand factor type A-domain-containing protein [Fimicolochytrium jonesii]KAI8822644.1 mediator complex subunit 25 von Willebrand factor type A-domain-containing protein [Fimicolochytrium jonesii]
MVSVAQLVVVLENSGIMSFHFRELCSLYIEPLLLRFQESAEDRNAANPLGPRSAVQFGLVVYADSPTASPIPTQKMCISNDPRAIIRAIYNVRYSHGGLSGNALTDGLVGALEMFYDMTPEYRGQAATFQRHCLLVASTPANDRQSSMPVEPKYDDFHLNQVIEVLRSENVRFSLITGRKGVLETLPPKINVDSATPVSEFSYPKYQRQHTVLLAGLHINAPNAAAEQARKRIASMEWQQGPSSASGNDSDAIALDSPLKRPKMETFPDPSKLALATSDLNARPVTSTSDIVAAQSEDNTNIPNTTAEVKDTAPSHNAAPSSSVTANAGKSSEATGVQPSSMRPEARVSELSTLQATAEKVDGSEPTIVQDVSPVAAVVASSGSTPPASSGAVGPMTRDLPIASTAPITTSTQGMPISSAPNTTLPQQLPRSAATSVPTVAGAVSAAPPGIEVAPASGAAIPVPPQNPPNPTAVIIANLQRAVGQHPALRALPLHQQRAWIQGQLIRHQQAQQQQLLQQQQQQAAQQQQPQIQTQTQTPQSVAQQQQQQQCANSQPTNDSTNGPLTINSAIGLQQAAASPQPSLQQQRGVAMTLQQQQLAQLRRAQQQQLAQQVASQAAAQQIIGSQPPQAVITQQATAQPNGPNADLVLRQQQLLAQRQQQQQQQQAQGQQLQQQRPVGTPLQRPPTGQLLAQQQQIQQIGGQQRPAGVLTPQQQQLQIVQQRQLAAAQFAQRQQQQAAAQIGRPGGPAQPALSQGQAQQVQPQPGNVVQHQPSVRPMNLSQLTPIQQQQVQRLLNMQSTGQLSAQQVQQWMQMNLMQGQVQQQRPPQNPANQAFLMAQQPQHAGVRPATAIQHRPQAVPPTTTRFGVQALHQLQQQNQEHIARNQAALGPSQQSRNSPSVNTSAIPGSQVGQMQGMGGQSADLNAQNQAAVRQQMLQAQQTAAMAAAAAGAAPGQGQIQQQQQQQQQRFAQANMQTMDGRNPQMMNQGIQQQGPTSWTGNVTLNVPQQRLSCVVNIGQAKIANAPTLPEDTRFDLWPQELVIQHVFDCPQALVPNLLKDHMLPVVALKLLPSGTMQDQQTQRRIYDATATFLRARDACGIVRFGGPQDQKGILLFTRDATQNPNMAGGQTTTHLYGLIFVKVPLSSLIEYMKKMSVPQAPDGGQQQQQQLSQQSQQPPPSQQQQQQINSQMALQAMAGQQPQQQGNHLQAQQQAAMAQRMQQMQQQKNQQQQAQPQQAQAQPQQQQMLMHQAQAQQRLAQQHAQTSAQQLAQFQQLPPHQQQQIMQQQQQQQQRAAMAAAAANQAGGGGPNVLSGPVRPGVANPNGTPQQQQILLQQQQQHQANAVGNNNNPENITQKITAMPVGQFMQILKSMAVPQLQNLGRMAGLPETHRAAIMAVMAGRMGQQQQQQQQQQP